MKVPAVKSIGILPGLLVLVVSTGAHTYEITLFPATKVFDPQPRALHQKLGLDESGLIVEDFEGAKLIEGLTVTLGAQYDSPLGLWYGSKSGVIDDHAEFRISLPNVRLFGIGVGDNDDGAEQISINGGPPIALRSLPNHQVHGQERAYYLLIKAAPGEEAIRSVAFSNAYTIGCDHLILKQDILESNRPLQLVLDLADGSRIIGTPAEKSIKLRFFGVDVEIPNSAIASVELSSGNRNAVIVLWNGDRFSADVLTNRWRVAAAFGEQSIPLELIRKIAVQARR